jgi:hypothetical protein
LLWHETPSVSWEKTSSVARDRVVFLIRTVP